MTYILGSQKIIVLQNIVLIQTMCLLDQQKDKKTLVIDSDMEHENETHSAGEDFTGVSGVTIECDNLKNVSEIILGQPK